MSPFFISSLFAFFVPMVLMESFEDFISIPDPIYFLWKFDENREVEMVKSDDIMLVTFDIPMNLEASVRKEIKLKAPKSIKFGDFFQMFIENYNATYHQEQIQFKNFNGVPYSWVFFVKPQGFFGSKLYIDPRISISENKINQNHIITIERTDT
jgi:hypothetical protein